MNGHTQEQAIPWKFRDINNAKSQINSKSFKMINLFGFQFKN